MPSEKDTIADEIRAFIVGMRKLAEASPVYSVIQPVVSNAIDHLRLRARYSEALHAITHAIKEGEDVDAA